MASSGRVTFNFYRMERLKFQLSALNFRHIAVVLAMLPCVLVAHQAFGNHPPAAEKVASPGKVDLGRVLIVYYSFSGKTAEVAALIQEATGGTLHRIETKKTYSPLQAIRMMEEESETEDDLLPDLQSPIPDIAGYDLILIGSPVWRQAVPPPLLSFLKQCDFRGKKVAAFVTSKGNAGNFFTLLRQKIRRAQQQLQGEEFNNNLSGTAALSSKVEAWLKLLKAEVRSEGGSMALKSLPSALRKTVESELAEP